MESIPLVELRGAGGTRGWIRKDIVKQYESFGDKRSDIFREAETGRSRVGLRRRIPWQQDRGAYEELPTQETSIDIPVEEVAVDLGEAGAAAELGEATVGAGTLLAGAGAATLGVAGIAAAGKYIHDYGAVVPGHQYLGPGNPTGYAPPRNYADAIAKAHDEAYEKASSSSAIRKADQLAIKQFGHAWRKEGELGALAGNLGLRAKYGVESLTGVLYPSLPGTSLGTPTLRAF